jgi:hypothetical protein
LPYLVLNQKPLGTAKSTLFRQKKWGWFPYALSSANQIPLPKTESAKMLSTGEVGFGIFIPTPA